MDKRLKKTIEVYDNHALIFADYADNIVLQYHCNKFISLLEGRKILDVGSGSGRDLRYFMDEKLKAYGIDLSFGMIRVAKSRGPGTFLQMDMLNLAFRDRSFDGIWSMGSLLHLSKKDAPKAVKEFWRVLRKEGVLLLGLKEGSGEGMEDSMATPGHQKFYAFYQQQEIELILEDQGFEIVNTIVEQAQKHNFIYIYARKKA